MDNCKKDLEDFLEQKKEYQQSKNLLKKMRKSGSYLSMENLDLDGGSDLDHDIHSTGD